MSDEYQLRKDVDKIYKDVYNLQNGELDVYKKEEIDNLLDDDYYDISEVEERLLEVISGGDLSDYVKKSDVTFTVSLEDNGTIIFNLGV